MATNFSYTDDSKANYGSTPPMTTSEPIKAAPRNLNEMEKGQPSSSTTGANADQWGNLSGLSDKNVRIKFIRKVYLIVSAQLLLTFAAICVFVFVQPVKAWATSGSTSALIVYLVAYLSFVVMIIIFSIAQCFKKLRTVPYNYLLLFGITVSLSYMLGMISSFHDTQIVLNAAGITVFITAGVTLFAMQTKYDFTNSWRLLLFMLVLSFVGWGIGIGLAYKYSTTMQGVYGGIGAVLMSIFLAIDTQLIIGNRKARYDSEDYIDAALQLYIDICYIFLYLLQLLGALKK